jgi:hypothetical protein
MIPAKSLMRRSYRSLVIAHRKEGARSCPRSIWISHVLCQGGHDMDQAPVEDRLQRATTWREFNACGTMHVGGRGVPADTKMKLPSPYLVGLPVLVGQ